MDNGGQEVGFCEKNVFRKGPMSTTSVQPTLYFNGYSTEVPIPLIIATKCSNEIFMPPAFQYNILE
jgi:hypothetical protein